jgi:hypothetical protein
MNTAESQMLLTADSQARFVYSDEPTAYTRARAFVTMSTEGQFKFIAERLRQVDRAELASIVRAIFGHPHDRGRRRRPTPGYELEL